MPPLRLKSVCFGFLLCSCYTWICVVVSAPAESTSNNAEMINLQDVMTTCNGSFEITWGKMNWVLSNKTILFCGIAMLDTLQEFNATGMLPVRQDKDITPMVSKHIFGICSWICRLIVLVVFDLDIYFYGILNYFPVVLEFSWHIN